MLPHRFNPHAPSYDGHRTESLLDTFVTKIAIRHNVKPYEGEGPRRLVYTEISSCRGIYEAQRKLFVECKHRWACLHHIMPVQGLVSDIDVTAKSYAQGFSLVVSILMLLRMMAFQPELNLMMGTISQSCRQLISFGTHIYARLCTQMHSHVHALDYYRHFGA